MANTKKIIDLSKRIGKNRTEDGSNLVLLDTDGDEVGITLIVKSILSKGGKALFKKQSETNAKKHARNKKTTMEEVAKSNSELVAEVVVGGDVFSINGEEIDPSKMTVEKALILNTEYPFIMTQITEFCSDDSNFYGDIKGN